MTDKINEYDRMLKGMLSKKRYTHSVNVADMCFKLATIHGADPVKAYTAGLLHDIQKEAEPEVMKREMFESEFYVDPVEITTEKLWHGIAGAYYVKNKLGITDRDILSSIRYHTVGNENMSQLEKIVYLGDLVSAERSYSGVEKFRAYALKDLNYAMYESFKWSIQNTMTKGGNIPVCTILGYNHYNNIHKTSHKGEK